MATFEYSVDGQSITTTKAGRLVSGTIGVNTVKFTFDSSWDGLEKWATFDPNPGKPYKQPLDANGECLIPGEVMVGITLRIGAFGLADGQAYPTVWANKLQMEEGCFIEVPVSDWPEPSPVIEEILEELENKVDKPEDATPGNVAIIGSNSNIEDSGVSKDNLLIAPQLTSNNIKTDSIPYIYRQTGGGIGVGNREYDSIVGGSIVHRQMFNNSAVFTDRSGVTTSYTDDDFTVNGTVSSAITARGWFGIDYTESFSNHVLYVKNSLLSGTISDMNSGWWSPSTTEMATKPNQERVIKSTFASSARGTWYSPSGVIFTNAKMRVNVYDLTERFGSAVADRIYAMETASAGSGIAVLHAMGLDKYRPYTATPSLESVSGLQSHKMVGFNLFDKSNYQYINAYLDHANGDKIVANFEHTLIYIPCFPNTQYTVKRTRSTSNERFGVGYTSDVPANGMKISGYAVASYSGTVGETMILHTTTDASAKYLAIWAWWMNSNETVAKDTLCVSITGDGLRDNIYEPYEEHTYPLDDSLTLRGVAILDDNSNIKFDGDEYAPDGTVTRRYGIITLNGSETNWNKSSSYQGSFYFNMRQAGFNYKGYGKVITPDLVAVSSISDYAVGKVYPESDSINFWLPNMESKTLAQFKEYVSEHPITVIYELSTPTTETTTPYESLQICDPLGTEEYVTTGICPVGHETMYPEDSVKKLSGLPSDFSTLIAPTEVTYKATRAYTTGRLLIVNNILYKATTSIASGATLTVGTNITATTLDEVIASL